MELTETPVVITVAKSIVESRRKSTTTVIGKALLVTIGVHKVRQIIEALDNLAGLSTIALIGGDWLSIM